MLRYIFYRLFKFDQLLKEDFEKLIDDRIKNYFDSCFLSVYSYVDTRDDTQTKVDKKLHGVIQEYVDRRLGEISAIRSEYLVKYSDIQKTVNKIKSITESETYIDDVVKRINDKQLVR